MLFKRGTTSYSQRYLLRDAAIMKNVLFILICILFSSLAASQEMPSSRTTLIDTGQIFKKIDIATTLEFLNPDSALVLLEQALYESRVTGFDRGIAAALVLKGVANMARGEAKVALANYILAMPYVAKCNEDKILVATLYTGIGFPYLKQGNYSLAATYYYKAQQIITENQLESTAIAGRLNMNLGNLWWALRRYDYTKRYFLRSEKIAAMNQDTAAMIAIYGNLGTLYYSLKDLPTSDSYMQKALRLAEIKHVVRAEQQLLANMGATLRQTGRAAAAIPYFEKAIALTDDAHAHQHNLQSYYNLAFAYYETGRYEKAKQLMLATIQKSEKLDMDKEHLGEAMQVMAGIYEKEANYKEANKWLNKYMAFIENTLAREADSSIHKLENDYRILEKNKLLVQNHLLLSERDLEIKNKNIWIGGICVGLILLTVALLVVIYLNKNRQHSNDMKIRSLQQEGELTYLKAMMEGEEKERMRLAMELHDGIGGMVAAAKMGLTAIKETNNYVHEMAPLEGVIRILNDTAAEIRHTAYNLMPDALIKNDLREALLLYCTDVNASARLEIDLQFHGQLENMSKSVTLILYRIAQELIQNIIKHAEATQAVIQIIQDAGRLNFIVEDNGIGFEQVGIDKGLGLQNLRFRVEALQGYISITSAKGEGTSVYIEFDLEKLKNV